MFHSCSGCLTPLLGLEKFVMFLTQGHIQRSGFLILFMSGAEQWHTLSCTSSVRFWQTFKPVLITACHHFCFKAFSLHLCLSVLLSLLSPACLLSLLSLPVSSIHPSLRHSQHVTSSISSISRSTCLSFSFFFSSKMLLSHLSGGFRHTNSPKILFSLSLLHFSNALSSSHEFLAKSLSSLFLFSVLPVFCCVVMSLWSNHSCLDFYSIVCRVRKLKERTIIN